MAHVQVWYCSAECQKTHWKAGGHKKQCKAVQAGVKMAGGVASAGPAAPAATRFPAAVATDGGACGICLDSDPPPIQSGCACRGDAGLAHVECRIMAAEHKEKASGNPESWQLCSTCGMKFNGTMSMGLGLEQLRRVQGRLDKVSEWIYAAQNIADTLSNAGSHIEAEFFCKETIAKVRRMGVNVDDITTAELRQMLAGTLDNQGKFADAQVIYESCLAEWKKSYGPDDPDTLRCARAFANNLRLQRKFVEATVILRDTVKRMKRVCGAQDPYTTLVCGVTLAEVLDDQGEGNEAQKLFQEILPVMKRVLGPTHPIFLNASTHYALSVARYGRLVDAR